MDNKQTYTLKEAATRLNTTNRQIRYFCDRGLIPGVRRSLNHSRMLNEEQLNWVGVLLGLKRCNMRSGEIKRYARLQAQGDSTIAERKAILDTKRRQIWQEIEERQASIDFIERQHELLGL